MSVSTSSGGGTYNNCIPPCGKQVQKYLNNDPLLKSFAKDPFLNSFIEKKGIPGAPSMPHNCSPSCPFKGRPGHPGNGSSGIPGAPSMPHVCGPCCPFRGRPGHDGGKGKKSLKIKS